MKDRIHRVERREKAEDFGSAVASVHTSPKPILSRIGDAAVGAYLGEAAGRIRSGSRIFGPVAVCSAMPVFCARSPPENAEKKADRHDRASLDCLGRGNCGGGGGRRPAAISELDSVRGVRRWHRTTDLAARLVRAWFSLIGTLAGFGVFLLFYLLGGMGGGDVKLMAGFGALLGGWKVLEAALVDGGVWWGVCGSLPGFRWIRGSLVQQDAARLLLEANTAD